MTYRIADDCVACGACQAECPEQAISEGEPAYRVDAAKCSACGTCAEVCPIGACVPA